jgi:L-aspartate oxidase
LAPRDVDDQLKKHGEMYVLRNISHKPRDQIIANFSNIAAECLQYGLEITQQPIPVVPATHFFPRTCLDMYFIKRKQSSQISQNTNKA